MITAAAINFALYWAGHRRLDSWDPIAFFTRVNTPSMGENARILPQLDDKSTAREGRQLLVTNVFRLRSAGAGFGWRAYRIDLRGFAIGVAIVIGLVLSTWLLVSS